MTVLTIPIESIVIPEIRSNAIYTPDSWKVFVESCKKGIRFPPKCRYLADGRYELVDGRHRMMAWKELGNSNIDVDVEQMTDAQALAVHLVGNHQRGEADPVGMARVIKKAHEEQGMSYEEIGTLIGYSASTCSKYEALLELPEYVLEALTQQRIKIGHVQQFARLDDDNDIQAAMQFSIQFQWSVDVLKYWVDARIAERQQVYQTPEMVMGQPIPVPEARPELAQQRQCLCCGSYDKAENTVFWQMCGNCANTLRYLKEVQKTPWDAILFLDLQIRELTAALQESEKKRKEMEDEIVAYSRRNIFGQGSSIPAAPGPTARQPQEIQK